MNRELFGMPDSDLTALICSECLQYRREQGVRNGIWNDVWITQTGERIPVGSLSFSMWMYCDHDLACRSRLLSHVFGDPVWREAYLKYATTVDIAIMASPRIKTEWAYLSWKDAYGGSKD